MADGTMPNEVANTIAIKQIRKIILLRGTSMNTPPHLKTAKLYCTSKLLIQFPVFVNLLLMFD